MLNRLIAVLQVHFDHELKWFRARFVAVGIQQQFEQVIHLRVVAFSRELLS